MAVNQQAVTREQLIDQLEHMKGQVINPVEGIFGPDSLFWEVNKYSCQFLGAGRAALLQIAHPWVATAVKQHSRTMDDPLSRFRGTFTHVYSMIFGNLDQVIDSALKVHAIHEDIQGDMEQDSGAFAKGTRYMANEVQAMMWVHATLWETAMLMYETVIGELSREQKERYYQESKMFAYVFGIPESALPPTWQDFLEYNRQMWNSDQLTVNDAASEIASFLFTFKTLLRPVLKEFEVFTGVIMPPRLQQQFGLPEDNARNRKIYEREVAVIRKVFPLLPRHLKYLPPYVEAQRRLKGKHSPGMITGSLNKLFLGRSNLVSA